MAEYAGIAHNPLAVPPPFLRKRGTAPQALVAGHRGAGYVAGTVTVSGAVASRLVRLYDRATGQLVAETTSAADGTYRFDDVAPELACFVLAFDDPAHTYNAAVADLITPAAE